MMISQSEIAKKYAIAYLNVYQDSLQKSDIRSLYAAYVFFKEHQSFMQLVSSVSFDKKSIERFFQKLCVDFGFPESMCRLMELLLKQKRIGYLQDVLQDICCLYKIRNNIVDLTIYTATELDENAIKEFEDFFAKKSQHKVESTVKIDTALIAGVRLQSNFLLWEYSIASRLRALKQKYVLV